jgi:hypothetical protein
MLKRYADILLAVLVLAWVVAGTATFFASPYYGFGTDFRTREARDADEGSLVRPGDRLIRANGIPLQGLAEFREALRARPAGAPLELEMERGGRRIEAVQPKMTRPTEVLVKQLGSTFVALLFLAVGLLVALRPTGKPGQLFYGFCLTIAYQLAWLAPEAVWMPPALVRIAEALDWAAMVFGAAFFLHFFLLFPAPHPLVRRLPWLTFLVYVPPTAFVVLLEAVRLATEVSFVPEVVVVTLGRGSLLVALAYFIWAGLAFVDSYRRMEDPVEKEKLRWLVWGVAISVVFAAAPFLLQNLLEVRIPYADFLILIALLFLPLSFGYAILSHRLMDIEIVVNRGLVYSAITLLLISVFIVVENVLAALSLELTGKSSFALAMGAALVMAALVDPLKMRIQSFVDHLFFAYKVKLREGLKDLAEELSFITDLERMEELLLRRLVDLGHVSRAALFLREEGGDGYVLVEAIGVTEWAESSAVDDGDQQARVASAAPERRSASGRPDGIHPRFDANAGFVIQLLRGTRPLSLETLPAAEFEQRIEHADVDVLQWVDAAVALPLRRRADLIGFILLSRRRNRELFNRDELDLLNGLAIQAAMDLTNARLQTRSRRLEEEVASLREELVGGLRDLLSSSRVGSSPAPGPFARLGATSVEGGMRTERGTP